MSIRSSRNQSRFDLENSIGYLVNRAASLLAARFSDCLKRRDVNLQAWRIMAALSQSDRQSVSELANHTGAELSYVSRLTEQLERRGLVKRLRSPRDKRVSLFSLTVEGRCLVGEVTPLARVVEGEGVRNVGADDLAATLRTLHAICENLVPNSALILGSDAPAAVNRKLTVARRVMRTARPPGS